MRPGLGRPRPAETSLFAAPPAIFRPLGEGSRRRGPWHWFCSYLKT